MQEITELNNIEQKQVDMAAILDLDEPVSQDVLQAAVEDSTYAHHLLVCRGQADLMNHLLSNPPQLNTNKDGKKFSSKDLLVRAAESMANWAKTGFSTVSDEVYAERLKVCNACPNLQAPPDDKVFLYKVGGANQSEPSVCSKCGCVVTVKARRSSDTCPDLHPQRIGFNRWEEALDVNR